MFICFGFRTSEQGDRRSDRPVFLPRAFLCWQWQSSVGVSEELGAVPGQGGVRLVLQGEDTTHQEQAWESKVDCPEWEEEGEGFFIESNLKLLKKNPCWGNPSKGKGGIIFYGKGGHLSVIGGRQFFLAPLNVREKSLAPQQTDGPPPTGKKWYLPKFQNHSMD